MKRLSSTGPLVTPISACGWPSRIGKRQPRLTIGRACGAYNSGPGLAAGAALPEKRTFYLWAEQFTLKVAHHCNKVVRYVLTRPLQQRAIAARSNNMCV